jgi:general secretion pathway protein K
MRGGGYVLMVWAVVALATIALAAQAVADRTLGRAVRATEVVAAEAVADGLLARGLFALLDPEERARLPRDDTPVEAEFLGRRTRLAVQDLAGLVNPNLAEPPMIEALFGLAGLDPDAARRATEALVRRRAPEEGAQSEAGPLRDLDALRPLPGMTPMAHRQLVGWMTLATAAAVVDPIAAPAPVLRAAGLSGAEVAALVLARRTQPDPTLPESVRSGPFARSPGRVFRLTASVLDGPAGGTGPGHTLITRRMEVVLAPGSLLAYRLIDLR